MNPIFNALIWSGDLETFALLSLGTTFVSIIFSLALFTLHIVTLFTRFSRY